MEKVLLPLWNLDSSDNLQDQNWTTSFTAQEKSLQASTRQSALYDNMTLSSDLPTFSKNMSCTLAENRNQPVDDMGLFIEKTAFYT